MRKIIGILGFSTMLAASTSFSACAVPFTGRVTTFQTVIMPDHVGYVNRLGQVESYLDMNTWGTFRVVNGTDKAVVMHLDCVDGNSKDVVVEALREKNILVRTTVQKSRDKSLCWERNNF